MSGKIIIMNRILRREFIIVIIDESYYTVPH